MKTLHLLPLLALLLALPAKAETTVTFREGLAVSNCHQYGRQALFTDQLAARMFAPGYKPPREGDVLFTNTRGQEVSWKVIKADTAGRFTGREGSNGYIYLTYTSDRDRGGVLTISGNAMCYWNGEPHAGDPYASGWLHLPVHIRKGINELYIRTSGFMRPGVSAQLLLPDGPIVLRTDDPTLPHIVPGRDNHSLLGAVVLINTTGKPLAGLIIRSDLKGEGCTEPVPVIPPYSTRKIAFRFDGTAVEGKGSFPCQLEVLAKGKAVAESDVTVESVAAGEPYSCTFISGIDGSVQYYAVNPRSGSDTRPGALFLSVHGAGVEAIGQARAYRPKDWGTLVAATNRRPRGFNWEDWGRLDALEVLAIARTEYKPDPQKIYLTGHSMGGHGTWYLGATYPDRWAAIAPCAGYASLMAYASADGKIPKPGDNLNDLNLYRASNGSNVPELVRNYSAHGVYVHHGDADPTVSVEYARQMRKLLGEFHSDFTYYEYPGGNHWWSNESVDWPPLFEFFRSHVIRPDSVVNRIDFRTANPAVSSSNRWSSILQQQEPLKYSTIRIDRDRRRGTFSGTTENISVLSLQTDGMSGDSLRIRLDGENLTLARTSGTQPLVLVRKEHWAPGEAPGPDEKGPVRNGTFKEPFNHRMVFVYGTIGTKEENAWALAKARYDAESWYYRGNGAVDLVADKDFIPANYADRGAVLYGNATTNKAWDPLLGGCPVRVSRGSLTLGDRQLTGDNFGAYFMYPRPDSRTASVAAVTGTGLPGMHAADANQYFSGGSGFPDYLIFTGELPAKGLEAVVEAGYYTNRWGLSVGPDKASLESLRFAPDGMYLKDHTLFNENGTWHLFAPMGPEGTMWWDEGSEESAEHFLSLDLVHWDRAATAVSRGTAPGAFDRQLSGLAPCIIRNGNENLMFFSGWTFAGKTPRNPDGFSTGIGVALSTDLHHWEKPVSFALNGLPIKGSDPFVIREESANRWLMFVTRHQAVAVYQSPDLYQWIEAGLTIDEADLKSVNTGMNPAESPFVMKHPLNGRWILFLNGGYALSDDPLNFPAITAYPFKSGIHTFPEPRDEGLGTFYFAEEDGVGFAHEVIQVNGRWYLTGVVGTDGHTRLKFTPLEWTSDAFRCILPSS